MTPPEVFSAAASGLAAGLALLLLLRAGRDAGRLDARLGRLSERGAASSAGAAAARLAGSALPKVAQPLLPADEGQRTLLHAGLAQAGLYGRRALTVFLAVKMLLMIVPWLLGLAAGLAGLAPLRVGLIGGAFLGGLGMIGPNYWLAWRTARRRVSIRRSLPDVLDVLVICLEAGLSLPAAFGRTTRELKKAHPLLGRELTIVQQEVKLGRSLGEALRSFADRSGLEELGALASLVQQTERFGAGLVKALRLHAEMLRSAWMQHVEEMAQKAGTKILFPTLLFIFPGIFVILIGPAAMQVKGMLNRTRAATAPAVKAVEEMRDISKRLK